MSSDFDFDFKVNNLAPPSQTIDELILSLSSVDYIIFKIAYNLLARNVIRTILIGELGQNY